MQTVKRRIFSGAVCEQIVYKCPGNVRNVRNYVPKPRFADEQERAQFNTDISRRKHARNFNANFSPSSLYSTLTFDDDYELHDFVSAKKVAANYRRRLLRKYPEAVIFFYMGRGKSTHRIHYHMVSDGIPAEYIQEQWKCGSICRISHLREHNYYDGEDRGQDYTGLANYLFNHWTPEQGGHRWSQTKNAKQPEAEAPTEAKRVYTAEKPPRAPKGYVLIEVKTNKYGYLYYKYIVKPKQEKKRKIKPATGPAS